MLSARADMAALSLDLWSSWCMLNHTSKKTPKSSSTTTSQKLVDAAGVSNALLLGPPGAARSGPTSESLPGPPEAHALPPGWLLSYSHAASLAWLSSVDAGLHVCCTESKQGLCASILLIMCG